MRIPGGARNDNMNCKRDAFSRRLLSCRLAKLLILSKKANFSASVGAKKWPRFPRLKCRGPIEALYSRSAFLFSFQISTTEMSWPNRSPSKIN